MATRVATIAFQALTLVLLVGLSNCILNGPPEDVAETTKGHIDLVSIKKDMIKYNGQPDQTLYARCKTFIGQFQSIIKELEKHQQSNTNSIEDTLMPRSISLKHDKKTWQPYSQLSRMLDPSLYLGCQKYIKHYAETFNANKESKGNGKRDVDEQVTSIPPPPPPPSSFDVHKKSKTDSVKNKEERRHSFIHSLAERMVRLLPYDNDLSISDVKTTTFQRVLHLAKRHILSIMVLVVIFLVITFFFYDGSWTKKIRGVSRTWSTSGARKSKPPAEVPLLPVQKPRDKTRQKQFKGPLLSEKDRYMGRFSPRDSQKREDSAIEMPVPKLKEAVSVTRTERIPVREKVRSEVEDPEGARLTLELLGFTLPKKAKYHLPSFIQKGYEEYTTTDVNWPNQESVDQESTKLKDEVKAFAQRTRRLHQLHPRHV